MSHKRPSVLQLLFKKIAKKFEALFFIAKDFLSERHFLYLSCVVVAISCAFAVIVLKAFAHYVFVFATYINGFLKLPFINSIFPIIGISGRPLWADLADSLLEAPEVRGLARDLVVILRRNIVVLNMKSS